MNGPDNQYTNEFTRLLAIESPIICGAMYPCSNPELVAAASEAGGIGIVQPISLTYVYGYDYRAGLQYIRSLTGKPIGVNMLVEGSSGTYRKRLEEWMEISLEEGVRFFVTALGNPRWVVDKASQVGGIVFHDATNATHAKKALDNGVDGFICVNNRAGGHAGGLTPQALYDEISPLGMPTICAGGVGDRHAFHEALKIGYLGVQMGTRFIASKESAAHDDYKNAIIEAEGGRHRSDRKNLRRACFGHQYAVHQTTWAQGRLAGKATAEGSLDQTLDACVLRDCIGHET